MSLEIFAASKFVSNFLGLTAASRNSENDLVSILRILNINNRNILRMDTKSFSETLAYFEN